MPGFNGMIHRPASLRRSADSALAGVLADRGAGAGPTAAAYCDVDGTLTDTSIVSPLVYMKRQALSPTRFALWQASLLARGPWWWLLDQFSRSASNRAIYSNYRGLSEANLRALAEAYYFEHIRPKLFPRARERLEKYRQQGLRLVLVTGGLDAFMQPMARDWGADCLAPSLEARGGVFTGALTTPAFTGKLKSQAIIRHAATHGIELKHSYALGDAIGDLPMLEAVGHPVAVNPDRRLAKVAAERGWPRERWRD